MRKRVVGSATGVIPAAVAAMMTQAGIQSADYTMTHTIIDNGGSYLVLRVAAAPDFGMCSCTLVMLMIRPKPAARIGGTDKYPSPMTYMAMGVGF